MDIYEELEVLESLQGSIAKEAQLMRIITRYKNADAFLRFTFNDVKYGVQEKTFKNAFSALQENIDSMKDYNHVSDWLATTEWEPMADGAYYKIVDLLKFGKDLDNSSGYAQEVKISNFIRQCKPLTKKWFCRAILKDLRCGVGLTTVNKIFRELGSPTIDKFALQLCSKKKMDLFQDEDLVKKCIKFPASMECKYDGIRLEAEIYTTIEEITNVRLTSRRGTDRTKDYPEIVKALAETFAGETLLLDGEIISNTFQDLTRKDSTATKKYVVFDLLIDEKLTYRHRWSNLLTLFSNKKLLPYETEKWCSAEEQDKLIINNNLKNIKLAEHYTCNNIKEAQEYYDEINSRGEEGIIIKLLDAPYERGSRKYMFKFKKVYTADLICVGFEFGEGRRTNKVSTLKLVDASNLVNVDVGSGITDDMSDTLTREVYEKEGSFIGKIVEVAFNERTETGSLRFPRFITFREDKDTPDDLTEMEVRQK